ncbi:MAG: protein kinase [Candidatus Melainabacteria bacterium]|nr:protein kinase [Candidatus Melainabacteria bacterium]
MTDLCQKCNRPRRVSKPASLTQWMFDADSCNCDRFDPATLESRETVQPDICGTCGKRVEKGRQGSFTQWIFRADICSCLRPDDFKIETELEQDARSLTEDDSPAASFDSSYRTDLDLTRKAGLPEERYQIIRLLGRGRNSNVYLCLDMLLSKLVSIKCLSSTWLGEQEVILFQKEARATSSLSHPNIVRILDFGATRDGQPYMVMEFAEGKTLAEIIESEGPLPQEKAVRIFSQICAGMEHAHQNNIYHRDLKPSNIIVLKDDRSVAGLKVIDFGIASVIHQDEDREDDRDKRALAGTPGYMSPDQLRGEPFDARSDIYSLGCLMFEVLSGRLPYQADSALEMLSKHAEGEIPSIAPEDGNITVDPELEQIVARALARDRENRFQSMAELAGSLEEHFGKPEFIEPDPGSSGTGNPRKQDPLLIPLLTGALFIFAGSITLSYWYLNQKAESEGKKIVTKTRVQDQFAETRSKTGNFTDVIPGIASADMNDTSLDDLPDDITELDLTSSNVTDRGLQKLLDHRLLVLRINSTQITDRGVGTVCKIKSLRKLDLADDANITGDSLRHAATLPYLESLALTRTRIKDEDLAHLAPARRLLAIALGACPNIHGEGLVYLRGLPHLRSLKLSGLEISDTGYKNLAALTGLTWLDLQSSNLDDERVDALLALKNLNAINMGFNSITDRAIDKIARLERLRELRIENCPGVSQKAVDRLLRKHPDCEVIYSTTEQAPVVDSLGF